MQSGGKSSGSLIRPPTVIPIPSGWLRWPSRPGTMPGPCANRSSKGTVPTMPNHPSTSSAPRLLGSAARAQRRGTLVYTVSRANGGIVLAPPARARYIARTHHAIETATTWAEFRRLAPRREYSAILRHWDDDGEPRPRGTDRFDSESVPGYCDGDYPAWLQQEMHEHVPAEILRRFATRQSTFLNGSYWHIDQERLAELIVVLEGLGYEVRDGSSMGTWH